jgi:hypothetical protein
MTYRAFCAALLAMFGVRMAVEWITRDKSGAAVARRYARVAWDGLREPVASTKEA